MQKMNEKDAIFVLKRIEAHGPLPIMAKEVAIQALEEIQQYRATGMTPEQIKEMQMDYCAKGAVLEEYKAIGTVKEIEKALQQLASEKYELGKFYEIGTPEQCREAVERMKPKKPTKEDSGCHDYDFDYKCPTCEEYIDDTANITCCGKCGQILDWSE